MTTPDHGGARKGDGTPPTFADQLHPLVDKIGTTESARICGVTPRTIQRWLSEPEEPNAATQAGAIKLLGEANQKFKP